MEIKVAKVKCNGCVTNIKNGLSKMSGIESVSVDLADGVVSVRGNGLERDVIVNKLTELGYPVIE